MQDDRPQNPDQQPKLRKTRMGSPWIGIPLFIAILLVGLILSIATIFILTQYASSNEMPKPGAQVIDWSEKLLGICVALAGSVAAILIAQSTLRQSDNLTVFEAELKEKEQRQILKEKQAERQERKDVEDLKNLQKGLALWNEFLSSVEQLFETADAVASEIIQRMINTDWKEQEFEIELDRKSLRGITTTFLSNFGLSGKNWISLFAPANIGRHFLMIKTGNDP